MNTRSAEMSVLAGAKFACVRIKGRANFTSSIDFKTLVNELTRQGRNYFVLDLSECVLMDSTFLGVLAGFGLKMNAPEEDHCDRGIELLNPNQRITELLENLGVLHLFQLTQGPLEMPNGAEARSHVPANPSREEVARACLEAHQTLMQISPENAARFKDVTQFLAEDLKKMKTGNGASAASSSSSSS